MRDVFILRSATEPLSDPRGNWNADSVADHFPALTFEIRDVGFDCGPTGREALEGFGVRDLRLDDRPRAVHPDCWGRWNVNSRAGLQRRYGIVGPPKPRIPFRPIESVCLHIFLLRRRADVVIEEDACRRIVERCNENPTPASLGKSECGCIDDAVRPLVSQRLN